MTDAELIKSSLVDAGVFALLFDRHQRALHRFLLARIGSVLAEDLAAETFTLAFRRRATYDLSRPDARPWLYGIAANLLRDHHRTEERRLRAYARSARIDQSATKPPVVSLDPAVAVALLELSTGERNLILLYAWAELSS